MCSVVSVISQEGLETFEKQEFRDLLRSNSESTFQNEVFAKDLHKQALAAAS